MNTVLRASTYGNGRAILDRALSERLPFRTSGALHGEKWDRSMVERRDLGALNTEEANAFMIDFLAGITYVVWSYQTPIAWVKSDGSVHKVSQRFSVTTSKHQGLLYML